MKTEILFGIHPVYEALKAGRRIFYDLYITKDTTSRRLKKTITLAEMKKIPIKKITPSKLKMLSETDTTQRVGAKVSRYPLSGIIEIVNKIKNTVGNPFLLLLDNVVDPHNLGALIRTGTCAGIDAVIITRDRSAPPTPAVSKSSAGALEHVYLALVTNMVNTIRFLKQNGLWVIGMDQNAKQSVFETDLSCPVAIVIGGEEKGIRPLVKRQCDYLISIPLFGKVDSLNASVAGGVTMYEVFRQRNINAAGDVSIDWGRET